MFVSNYNFSELANAAVVQNITVFTFTTHQGFNLLSLEINLKCLNNTNVVIPLDLVELVISSPVFQIAYPAGMVPNLYSYDFTAGGNPDNKVLNINFFDGFKVNPNTELTCNCNVYTQTPLAGTDTIDGHVKMYWSL